MCKTPKKINKTKLANQAWQGQVHARYRGGSWENIAWVMNIKCSGHNNHGSCCACTNSQDTLPQHPEDHFLIKYFFTDAGHCIHDVESHCLLVTALSLTSSVVNSLFKRKKHPLIVHITLVTEGGTAAAMGIVASTFASWVPTPFFSEKRC